MTNQSNSTQDTAWHLIESAPKDGIEIKGRFADGTEATVRWFTTLDRALYDGIDECGDDCWLNCDSGEEYVHPTHWKAQQ